MVTRALLLETPDIDAAALRLKVAKYFLGKFFWLQNKPGPFDRGPLTLLQYLRVALHNGGFPGLHGNAAFEPLRRELRVWIASYDLLDFVACAQHAY